MMTSLDRIICGDCVNVLEMFGADLVDLTLTSAGYEDARTYHGFRFDFRKVAKALWRVTKQGGVVVWILRPRATNRKGYSFRDHEQAIFFKTVGFRAHDVILYRKRNPSSKRTNAYNSFFDFMFVFTKGMPKTFHPLKVKTVRSGYEMLPANRKADGSYHKVLRKLARKKTRTNIWEHEQTTNDKNRFPEKLAEDHIRSWTNKGDLVLDPMCGSGTTCKMAKLLGRHYLGIEPSSKYCKIARQRIAASSQSP